MKAILFLMTAFFANLSGKPPIWEPEPPTPLATTEIKTDEQTHYDFAITGIHSQMVRTAEKDIKIELFAEETTNKNPVSKEDFFKEYTFNVRQTDHAIEVQFNLKTKENPGKKWHKWLVIHLPENNGFRLESSNKMSFGTGFPNRTGFYSGTVNIEQENKAGKLN